MVVEQLCTITKGKTTSARMRLSWEHGSNYSLVLALLACGKCTCTNRTQLQTVNLYHYHANIPLFPVFI